MNTKLLLLVAGLSLCEAVGAQHHADLNLAASKVDMNGSYLQLNKIDQELDVVAEYAALGLDYLRANGEDVPENLDTKALIKGLGLGEVKALAQSSTRQDSLWLNKAYLQLGKNDAGVFSLFGDQAKAHTVTEMCPVGTDLAVQAQLDLRQLEDIVCVVADAVGKSEGMIARGVMALQPEGMEKSCADLLAESHVTVNLAVDVDLESQSSEIQIGFSNAVARVDGLAWAWEMGEDSIMEAIGLPFKKTEQDQVATYTLDEVSRKELSGYLPVIVVDKKLDHIWVATEQVFLEKCRDTSPKLKSCPSFQHSWSGLPTESNSMYYLSPALIKDIAGQYTAAAESGALGEEFNKVKPLADRVIADLTKHSSGFGGVLAKDADGLLFVSKSPVPFWLTKLIRSSLPYFADLEVETIELGAEEEKKGE